MTIPELQLWRMVLIQSALDLFGIRPAVSQRERQLLAAQAQLWFENPATSPGSFNWVAAVLDLDADTVRRKVLSVQRATMKARVRQAFTRRGDDTRSMAS
jgi:hypothetical protein